jgi:hypothetical protein
MKTLSSLFVFCQLLLDFSNTEGTISEDCGLDLGLPGETILFRVVWGGCIP